MKQLGRLLLAVLLPACIPRIEGGNPLRTEITVEREMEIGAEIHAQLRQSGVLLTDHILREYVNDLGQKLVQVTEPQPFIYRFSLIEDDALNAFAVPGGYIYLHTGVLAQAGDLSELAGVLAHEVAHVRRRHIAQAQENQALLQLATLAAAVLSGGHPAAIAVAQGINVSLEIQHTREHEADADFQGVGYMVEAGYDPVGMTRFFQRIMAEYGPGRPGIPPYLFTHPAIDERIAAVRVQLKRDPPPRNLVRVDKRLRVMQARLAALQVEPAGGTRLLARPTFDRSRTDPLLEKALLARGKGRTAEAEAFLQEAQRLEPNDPRVAIDLAKLAEEEDRLEDAATALQRAVSLDPSVALVHYRLGLIHKRLGNRSQAVFHLEEAVSLFGGQSTLRRRAELEIRTLSFPLLKQAGLGSEGRRSRDGRSRFQIGETVMWWGTVSRQLVSNNPLLHVRWIDPSGAIAEEDPVRMGPFGSISADLETTERPLGRWEVRVTAGDSLIDRRSFVLVSATPDPQL